VTLLPDQIQRLQFLYRVVGRESEHLAGTAQRLFAQAFTLERAAQLQSDAVLAEQVEAFASRFARLQDTLGDKLLPALLAATQERVGTQIDNLDRAERLGWLPSTDQWIAMRRLRNQMVHEYIEDMLILADALETAKSLVPTLLQVTRQLRLEVERRGWA
jgi:hypothetical protein